MRMDTQRHTETHRDTQDKAAHSLASSVHEHASCPSPFSLPRALCHPPNDHSRANVAHSRQHEGQHDACNARQRGEEKSSMDPALCGGARALTRTGPWVYRDINKRLSRCVLYRPAAIQQAGRGNGTSGAARPPLRACGAGDAESTGTRAPERARARSTRSRVPRPGEADVDVRRRLLVHVVPDVLGPCVLDQLLPCRTCMQATVQGSQVRTRATDEEAHRRHAARAPQEAGPGQSHAPRSRTCPCPCRACSRRALCRRHSRFSMVPDSTSGDGARVRRRARRAHTARRASGGMHRPASQLMLRK